MTLHSSYAEWSKGEFAGAVHDFTVPMRKRAESRKVVGPYYMKPMQPGAPRGFYMEGRGFAPAKHGACFDLRLEEANDHLPHSGRRAIGYYCDESQDDTLQPIIARLPHGRGFLAGWTMGAGMISNIDPGTIYSDEESAAYAAHSMAEYDAEESRDAARKECSEAETDED